MATYKQFLTALALTVITPLAIADNLENAQNSDSYITPTTTVNTTSYPVYQRLALTQVGEADMDFLWLDIYLAKLYSASGQYQPEQYPLMLEIEYHRDISSQELMSATVEQWQKIGVPEEVINSIRFHLDKAWPDVNENDRLSFVIHDESKAEFLFNDQSFYQLNDHQFSQAFVGIWLSEKTTRPELRQQLIGAIKQ
ncbi:chalcone isomerase family protein [Shewanella gaetbuli]|uniref:Chalcone isomerase family protein n=1 Tax=Shewanella gaetbuli TaxID=220752 RepID=A0A9X2CGU8_9GAMM|nr:chalcone isomerase family protein [Shewanella gaetbuli]MCL1141302.1 chalcone isomerase family protein [Shewanella gaetbuli]